MDNSAQQADELSLNPDQRLDLDAQSGGINEIMRTPGWLRATLLAGATALTLVGCAKGGEIEAAPALEQTITSTSMDIDSQPIDATTTTEAAISPEAETVIDLLVLNNKDSDAEAIYSEIDWSSFEDIDESSPGPMEIITAPGEKVNAQDVVDAWFFNRDMMFLTNDPGYQEAIVDKWPLRNYDESIADFYATRVDEYVNDLGLKWWEQEEWGEALSIEPGEEDGAYVINGQMVYFVQNSLFTALSIHEFSLPVAAIKQPDGTTKWVETASRTGDLSGFEIGKPIMNRDNPSDDTAFVLHREGKIILPYVEKP